MDATIEHHEMGRFIQGLLPQYDVIAPVSKDGRFIFDRIDDPSQIVVQYDTTLLPPVKWIYPNHETLLKFDLRDITQTEVVIQSRKQVLLFVHPCDINAINLMDEVLAEEPSDVNYLTRRRSSLIIGYECLAPCRENILCYDKGYHIAQRGYDLFFTNIGERYYVSVATEAGNTLIEENQIFRKAGYIDWKDLMMARSEREKGFKKSLNGDAGMLSHILKESYDNEIWDIEGKKCLSCGACVIVCPTCYCFDVIDELCPDMEEGTRYRRWDGCQLRGFCKIATGENFRKSAAERVRHRVFKKEVYLKKRFGRSGCVGCGRCIDSCIAKISIIDIYNHVMERTRNHV